MAAIPHPVLDMSDESISNVQSTVELDVVTRQLDMLGTIHPLAAESIEWNTDADVKRTVSGTKLTRQDANDIDLFRHCLRPMWVLGDGSRWQMGVYAFTDYDALWRTAEDDRRAGWVDVALMDSIGFTLKQATKRTVTVPPTGDVFPIVLELLDESGIPPQMRDIPDQLEARVLDPPVWPAGTPKQQIIDELMEKCGMLPSFSNNGGVFVIKPPPDVITATPDNRYLTDEVRIVDGSVKIGNDLLTAPNVYLVTSNGPNDGEITGVAYVDPFLPWSRENRGFEIVDVYRAQGIESAGAATEMAVQRAETSAGFRVAEFDAFPDPRHDLFQTVEFDQVIWRETRHTLRLSPGGPHSHSITEGGFPSNAATT